MSATMTAGRQNRFVFVSPMYNAASTLPRMLHSLFGQSYDNWHLILIDDVSDADNIELSEKIIDTFIYFDNYEKTFASRHLDIVDGDEKIRHSPKITFIKNSTKRWEVANVLRGIRECDDDDIVCRIDADDWLTDLDALAFMNALYNQSSADALWTAHRWGFTDRNISGPMPIDADPYSHSWVSSHLKTFRKRLIDGVPYENFTNMDGELVRRAGDQAIYLPVLRRAKMRGYVPRVFYHYTIDEKGGAVYQTDDARFQKEEADFIRKRGYVSSGPSWEEVMVKT